MEKWMKGYQAKNPQLRIWHAKLSSIEFEAYVKSNLLFYLSLLLMFLMNFSMIPRILLVCAYVVNIMKFSPAKVIVNSLSLFLNLTFLCCFSCTHIELIHFLCVYE